MDGRVSDKLLNLPMPKFVLEFLSTWKGGLSWFKDLTALFIIKVIVILIVF